MIVVKRITAQQTYNIRKEVLRKGINLPSQFTDDFDKDTFHLGVYEKDLLVGISSFMKTSNPDFGLEQYQLRGMATLTDVRGKGYGKLMLNEAFLILRDKQIPVLWCNAREIAVNFYEEMEFLKIGKLFLLPEIGMHYKMYKKIE